jgi:VWFA-related protein
MQRLRHRHQQMRVVTAILLASFTSPPISPSPEEPQQGSLIQREEVRFVTLDIVVEDKRSGKWRRTSDLRQEQIKVVVGGKEVPLDTFEPACGPAPGPVAAGEPAISTASEAPQGEAQEEPEPAAADVHRYILYFDLENLTMAGRVNAFRAAEEWAGKSVLPEDEVMIVTGGLSLRVVRPLRPASSHLLEDIQAAVKDFSGVDMWADGERARRDEIARARSRREKEILANAFAAIDYDYARRGLEYMRTVLAMYDSVPGLKNLILFSETLRQVPGSIYLPATSFPSVTIPSGQRALPDVTMPMQQLAREASDKNVRIYTVQAGGMDRDIEDPMTFLSTETGGSHVEWTNRLAEIFDRTREDLECFYRIGFRLPSRQSGHTERITIRVPENESKYRLRYRRTLDDPTRKEREEASIRAAYLRPSAAKGFPVGLEVTRLKREERGVRFRMQILVPLDGLVALPGADPAHRNVLLEVGGLVLPLTKTADVSGLMEDIDVWTDVSVSRESLKFARRATLQIPSARPAGAPRGRKAGLYTREFLAPPGRYRLVIVASDLNGHAVSAAVTEFESTSPAAPLAVTLGFEGHDLVPLPAEDPGSAEKKEKAWNGKELENAAPEIPAAMLLATRPGIGSERTLWALYEVCRPGAGGAAANQAPPVSGSRVWKLDRMLDCMGKSLELPALPLTPPAGEAPCIVVPEKMPSSELPQGSCRLSVVLNQDGKVEPAKELEFTVLPPSLPSTPAAKTP